MQIRYMSIKKFFIFLSVLFLGLAISNTAYGAMNTFVFEGCNNNSQGGILDCWLGKVFDWATVVVGSIAVVAIMVGGVIYMTSGGNPNQVATAKKIILNALIAAAVIILGKFFLTNVLGVDL